MSLYEADEVPVATLIDSDTKRSIDITVYYGRPRHQYEHMSFIPSSI